MAEVNIPRDEFTRLLEANPIEVTDRVLRVTERPHDAYELFYVPGGEEATDYRGKVTPGPWVEAQEVDYDEMAGIPLTAYVDATDGDTLVIGRDRFRIDVPAGRVPRFPRLT